MYIIFINSSKHSGMFFFLYTAEEKRKYYFNPFSDIYFPHNQSHMPSDIMRYTCIVTRKLYCTVTNIIYPAVTCFWKCNLMRSHHPACLHLNLFDLRSHSLACTLQMICIGAENCNHIPSQTTSLSGCDYWIAMWAKCSLCEYIATVIDSWRDKNRVTSVYCSLFHFMITER